MAPCSRTLLILLALTLCAGPSDARKTGIVGQAAPALWAQAWRNLPAGESVFDVQAQRGRVVVLFFFQSWCPGCHRRGFPTLKAAVDALQGAPDVAFATVQTVFEGASVNTPQRAWSSAAEYGLKIPVGHDPGPRGARSLTMARYRSGGTPWFVVIDREGVVRFDGFHSPATKLLALIRELRFEPGPMSVDE